MLYVCLCVVYTNDADGGKEAPERHDCRRRCVGGLGVRLQYTKNGKLFCFRYTHFFHHLFLILLGVCSASRACCASTKTLLVVSDQNMLVNRIARVRCSANLAHTLVCLCVWWLEKVYFSVQYHSCDDHDFGVGVSRNKLSWVM